MFNQKSFHLNFPKSRGDYFIFSLPQSNNYQTIADINCLPAKHEIRTIDEKARFAHTLIINLNDVNNNISVKFKAQLKAVKITPDFDFEIEDYNGPSFEKFLKPDRFINGHDKNIKTLAEGNVKDSANVSEIITSLYNFTLQYLDYGKPNKDLHPYKQALIERTTDCGGFSTFLASLLQSAGIPSRLVVGFLVNKKPMTNILSIFDLCSLNFDLLIMHAWLEVLLPNNAWFPLDPSVEWRRNHHQSQRQGGFGYLPADRLVTSFGQDFKIKINNKVRVFDILQNPIII